MELDRNITPRNMNGWTLLCRSTTISVVAMWMWVTRVAREPMLSYTRWLEIWYKYKLSVTFTSTGWSSYWYDLDFLIRSYSTVHVSIVGVIFSVMYKFFGHVDSVKWFTLLKVGTCRMIFKLKNDLKLRSKLS